MKFFVALAAALVLAQGAEAVQTKKTAKSMKKKSMTTSSASTASSSELNAASIAPAGSPASTSTAKASTTLGSLKSRIGMDWYSYAESNIRQTNTDGGVVDLGGSYVGMNYKLTDSSKVYLRQQYGFAVPGTGAGKDRVDEMKMRADDVYLRYQNSKFATFGNEIKLGGRATLTLPTGEDARNKADSAHNGKLSVRGTLAQKINSVLSWDYLAQVGYNNMANKGTFSDKRSLIVGTTQISAIHQAGLNADVAGFTFTQALGQKAGWKNETVDVGVEQTNKLLLTTAVAREFGPVYLAIGVTQEADIMSDAAEKFSADKIYDDETTAYYLEMNISI